MKEEPWTPDEMARMLESIARTSDRYHVNSYTELGDITREAAKMILRLDADIGSLNLTVADYVSEAAEYRIALEKIANGEGYYGAQAREYKQIAKRALEVK